MKKTIHIAGMSCGGCVNSVRKALERLPVTVEDVQLGSASVEYDQAVIGYDSIVEAITDAGFEVPAGG